MTREELVEKMTKAVAPCEADCAECKSCEWREMAEALYEAGYRKQSEGEWETVQETTLDKAIECTVCKNQFWFMKKGQLRIDRMPFCPKCGAKMKGGGESGGV